MNTHWVFRLEHTSIKFDAVYGIGPYHFMNNIRYDEFKTRPDIKLILEKVDDIDIKRLRGLMEAQESSTELKKKYKEHYKFEPTCNFSGKVLPCSFSVKRPGPWNDPLLHQSFVNRGIDLLKDKLNAIFGFESNEQLHKWFDDPIELEILKRLGFDIVPRKIDSNKILFGMRQCCIVS